MSKSESHMYMQKRRGRAIDPCGMQDSTLLKLVNENGILNFWIC